MCNRKKYCLFLSFTVALSGGGTFFFEGYDAPLPSPSATTATSILASQYHTIAQSTAERNIVTVRPQLEYMYVTEVWIPYNILYLEYIQRAPQIYQHTSVSNLINILGWDVCFLNSPCSIGTLCFLRADLVLKIGIAFL